MARPKTKEERAVILTEAWFCPFAHGWICAWHDISRSTLWRWQREEKLERLLTKLPRRPEFMAAIEEAGAVLREGLAPPDIPGIQLPPTLPRSAPPA